MEASARKTSRKWHPDQEKLFLEHIVRSEFKPIGGQGDGVMERKVEARWVLQVDGLITAADSERQSPWNAAIKAIIAQNVARVEFWSRNWDCPWLFHSTAGGRTLA
jgi:hypothetical protein